MDCALSPRESGEYIAERSKNVFVVEDSLQKASEIILARMIESKYSMKTWKTHELHPKEMTETTLNWIFVLDCLNFSFWTKAGEPSYKVAYMGKNYIDYEALCAVINRALQEGISFTSPEYYKNMTISDARKIFESATSTEIPLIERRVEHLREAGKILCEQYGGSIGNLIKECNNSATTLVSKLVSLFSSFKDEAIYERQRVAFYKRAQIFVADVWACFEGEGYGKFDDIGELTMFADYRVPQCLLFLGILKYSEELQEKVLNEEELAHGSIEEMEIRGCSINAVECLRTAIESQLSGPEHDCYKDGKLNSIIIDFYLWDYATLNSSEMETLPEHRTRTYFY
eukprot:Seg4651.4 transcript_id=Seg4651.4/GoldUCD/mRNA.D3Y31 product="Queuosine salvage protein" protein_id=Seg4651.4/GoldUCD/D3Y31